MFGLQTLDVGIGLTLMFLSVSLICSAIREFIEVLLKTRGKQLERGIRELFGEGKGSTAGTTTTASFYEHPIISALYSGQYREACKSGAFKRNALPSYIPAESFAQTVLQLARTGADVAKDAALTAQGLRKWAGEGQDAIHKAVLNALDVAADDLTKAQLVLEQWFDGAMDRVSGWYKRKTQAWLFVIGLVCAAVLNIDAITVTQHLATDQQLRDKVVATAGGMIAQCAKDPTTCQGSGAAPNGNAPAATPTTAAPAQASGDLDAQIERIKGATAQMTQLSWPIGWADGNPDPQYRSLVSTASNPHPTLGRAWILIIIGWVITALGVTFGAAFWFDILNKIMVIRSTIKPDEKSPKEKSKG